MLKPHHLRGSPQRLYRPHRWVQGGITFRVDPAEGTFVIDDVASFKVRSKSLDITSNDEALDTNVFLYREDDGLYVVHQVILRDVQIHICGFEGGFMLFVDTPPGNLFRRALSFFRGRRDFRKISCRSST